MSAAIFTYAETVLRYFNPSRSPFYAIIAVAVIALELADNTLKGSRWALVATILLAILTIGVTFSLSSKVTMAVEEYSDQLSLSRSICISAALLALWFFGANYEDDPRFYCVVALALFQAVTFLLYTWAGTERPPTLHETNYVQLGLITTTLFLGALFLLKKVVVSQGQIDWWGTADANTAAIVLLLLWIACMRVWLRLISTLVIFLQRRPVPDSGSGKSPNR
jgi:hypothetical protein